VTELATTSTATALLIVFSNPAENADEQKFNRWYTQVHVPDILRLGGARSARRYRSSGVELLPGIPEPGQFAAIYQVEADTVADVRAIADKLRAGLAAGQADVDPSMDLSSVRAAWVLPISDEITS
jgi:hypothetical protein